MIDGISLRTSLSDLKPFRIPGRPSRYFSVPGILSIGPGGESPAAVFYTVNDQAPADLNLGPDGARLAGTGDFVADIPWNHLRQGSNVFCLTARWADGSIRTFEQSFVYHQSDLPEGSLAFNFRGRSLPGEAGALAVDGLWKCRMDGLSPEHPGYDRLVALGDVGMRDYTVLADLTLHGFAVDAPGYPEAMGPGVGILLRWTGHHPDGRSPMREWRPIGALAWYRYGRDAADTVRDYRLQLMGGRMKDDVRSEPIAEDVSGRKLPFGIPLTFKADVWSMGPGPARYRLKVWPTGTPEPSRWDLEGFGMQGEAETGSALIVLHYAEATIHGAEIIRRTE